MLAYKFTRVEKWQLRTFVEESLGSFEMIHKTPKYYYDGEMETFEEWTTPEEFPYFTIAVDVLILWESKEEAKRWLEICEGRGYRREEDLKEWLEGQIIGE